MKVASKPTDPTSYSLDLFKIPYEQLKSWWLCRPMNELFALDKKVRQIEGYSSLLSRVFGYQLFVQDAADLLSYSDSIRGVFGTAEEPPSPAGKIV